MARFLHHDFPFFWRKGCTAFLAMCWLLGLLSGAVLSGMADPAFSSMMHAAAASRVSIVRLLTVTVLPFLCSAFAVYLSRPWLLLPMAYCKGLTVSCAAFGLMTAFGSAGWLLRGLTMFSSLCTAPVLVFYWLRHISGERRFSGTLLLFSLAAVFLVCGIDFCYIAPILAKL